MRPGRDRPEVRVALASRHFGDRRVGERRRVLQHRAGDVGVGIARQPSQGEGRPVRQLRQLRRKLGAQVPRFRSFQSSRSSRRASGAPAARNSRVSVTALKASSTSRAILGIDVLLVRTPPKYPAAARFRRTIPGRSAARRRQRSRDKPAWRAGRGPEGKTSRCRSAPASPEPLSIPDG